VICCLYLSNFYSHWHGVGRSVASVLFVCTLNGKLLELSAPKSVDGKTSACTDPEIKGEGHKGMKCTCRGYTMSINCLCSLVADVLVTCTVYRGAHNKEMLIKELDRLAVNYDVRRLQVGDFLWIAQHISGADDVTLFQYSSVSLISLQFKYRRCSSV